MKAPLQKHLARKCREKQHFKHAIVIPYNTINELSWKDRQEPELLVKDGELVAAPKHTRRRSQF
jgi:hypothetical protein